MTIIQTAATNITIKKSIDEITIRDIEDVLSGTSSLEVNIEARKQVDEIRIIRPAADSLTVKD